MRAVRLAAVVAAVLAFAYAAVLLVAAVALVVAFGSGSGALSAAHLSYQAEKGVVALVLILVAGSAVLVTGSIRLVRSGKGTLVMVPLAGLLAVGVPGETVDVVTGSPPRGNVVGAGILVLAVIPIVLIRYAHRRSHVRRPTSTPTPAATVARGVVTTVLIGAVGVVWALTMSAARQAMSFEPSTGAVARSAAVTPHVVAYALIAVALASAVSLWTGRVWLLLLAVPSVVTAAALVFAPDAAAFLLGLLATGAVGAVACGVGVVAALRKWAPGDRSLDW